VLGWMYHRTGNLWLNIIAHGLYNATAVTILYVTKLRDPGTDLAKVDPQFPLWMGIVSVVILYGLFILFEKVSSYQISQPGKEVLMPIENTNQPSWIHQTDEGKSL